MGLGAEADVTNYDLAFIRNVGGHRAMNSRQSIRSAWYQSPRVGYYGHFVLPLLKPAASSASAKVPFFGAFLM